MKFSIKQTILFSDFNSVQSNPVVKGQPVKKTIEKIGVLENEHSELTVLTFEDGDIATILDVDGAKQYLFLKRDTTFPPVNRTQMITAGMHDLFEEPDTYEFDVNDLKFTSEITDDDTGITYDREYSILGEYEQTPYMKGLENLFAGFTQYFIRPTEKETVLHFLAILEIGTLSSADGGAVSIYKGWTFDEKDIA